MDKRNKSEKVQGVRLDQNTQDHLDILVNEFGMNRAEIMRKGIAEEIKKTLMMFKPELVQQYAVSK